MSCRTRQIDGRIHVAGVADCQIRRSKRIRHVQRASYPWRLEPPTKYADLTGTAVSGAVTRGHVAPRRALPCRVSIRSVTEEGEERPDLESELAAELAERETAYGLLQRAKLLLKKRHHAQAAVLLERAARLEPGKGSIVEALARAYYNSGQHDRAAETFRELLEIDPTAAYGHFGLGQSLKQLGQRDEARTHLRLAVAMAPDSSLYRSALNRLG